MTRPLIIITTIIAVFVVNNSRIMIIAIASKLQSELRTLLCSPQSHTMENGGCGCGPFCFLGFSLEERERVEIMNIDARIRKLKNELKIPPNKFEWTKHIKNCCDAGDMKNAHESLQAMMRHGVEPDVITFNTLIDGWCKVDKMSIDECDEIYAKYWCGTK